MPDINIKYNGDNGSRAAIIEIDDVSLGLNQFSLLSDLVAKEMESGLTNFVFDFSKLNSINSSGLGILISCLKKVKEGKGSLKISNVNEKILNIFKLTKLDKVFDLNAS